MAEATHAERSKLVQRQKQQRAELEKKVKKLKGAMKEAAQKELEELEGKHEAELVEFDKGQGLPAKEVAEEKAEAPAVPTEGQNFRDRQWAGLSKKELEEACSERGLGKKGSKEDLVQKLIIFHQELKQAAASAPPSSAAAPAASKDKDSDDDDDEDESDEEDDDSEEEEDEADKVSAEEAAKQFEREKKVRQAMRYLLTEKCPEGFPISELCDRLASIKVSGFAPEKLGYKTVEKFVKAQPEKYLRYDKKAQMVLPPK
mmetsp:Transcript_86907/g.251048  ORF Transcript_86907/g.251048 Transcript_86907/m.251048 type:complete len:259 (+) Transcript_86907:360-1136(+)